MYILLSQKERKNPFDLVIIVVDDPLGSSLFVLRTHIAILNPNFSVIVYVIVPLMTKLHFEQGKQSQSNFTVEFSLHIGLTDEVNRKNML